MTECGVNLLIYYALQAAPRSLAQAIKPPVAHSPQSSCRNPTVFRKGLEADQHAFEHWVCVAPASKVKRSTPLGPFLSKRLCTNNMSWVPAKRRNRMIVFQASSALPNAGLEDRVEHFEK